MFSCLSIVCDVYQGETTEVNYSLYPVYISAFVHLLMTPKVEVYIKRCKIHQILKVS